MYKTIVNSSLYFKVHKIHHIGDNKVKCKLSFYYKTSGEPCLWLRKKNYSIIRCFYDSWIEYKPLEG